MEITLMYPISSLNQLLWSETWDILIIQVWLQGWVWPHMNNKFCTIVYKTKAREGAFLQKNIRCYSYQKGKGIIGRYRGTWVRHRASVKGISRKNRRESVCIDLPPACMYILRTKFWIFLLPAITAAFNYISLGRKEPTSGSSVWYWNNAKCLHS